MDRRGWDQRYAGTDLIWTAAPNRFLAAEVPDLPSGRALDLACGEGRNAVWLAERGWQVTGVDFSQVALDKAARLAAERDVSVQWQLADLREYVPPLAAFELVVVLYLHVPATDRRRIHDRAAQALADGGVLLVVGHDTSNLEQGHGGPQNPAILFTPAEVVGDVPQLEIERAERVRRPVGSPPQEAWAIDALIRARRPRIHP
ncbi:MAG: class I SAM-dependent methyltransferase [Solirubrobacteraceae bacterium]